jgi:hypothetical protein
MCKEQHESNAKQTKEEFLSNVKHYAKELQAFKDDLRVTQNNFRPVSLDNELHKIWERAFFHETEMLKSAVQLAELCKQKLEQIK